MNLENNLQSLKNHYKKNSKKVKENFSYNNKTSSEFLSTEEINKTIKNNIIGIGY